MDGPSHQRITEVAFDLLSQIDDTLFFLPEKNNVAAANVGTDHENDLEFVRIKGLSRDDPHRTPRRVGTDEPIREDFDNNFTAFNHFIDIRKGPGKFDDFDGYSYSSASLNEYENLCDAKDNKWLDVLDALTRIATFDVIEGIKVDRGVNWWESNCYVHAPGHQWYRYGACSPSIERYSFYGDRGSYASLEEEATRRFPLADSPIPGSMSKGVPGSVFMPVDNMARYWFNSYRTTKNPDCLGPVLHAIQDASIPQHAAGYLGNWHGKWERTVSKKILNEWTLPDTDFMTGARELFDSWNWSDNASPAGLSLSDAQRSPCRNWRIDMLVTWQAINAYNVYSGSCRSFANGWVFDSEIAKRLTMQATAMSMLALCAATGTLTPRGVPMRRHATDDASIWLLH